MNNILFVRKYLNYSDLIIPNIFLNTNIRLTRKYFDEMLFILSVLIFIIVIFLK